LGKNVSKPQGGFFDSHCSLLLSLVPPVTFPWAYRPVSASLQHQVSGGKSVFIANRISLCLRSPIIRCMALS